MKKIQILSSLTILSATVVPTVATLASCGCKETSTIKAIPEEMLNVQDNILIGLKEGASIDAYDTLVIPENIVYIASEAFKDVFVKDTNSSTVTTVIFNKNLRGMGSKAFGGCTNLTCLDFSSMNDMRIMSIIFEDGTVFYNCSNETGTVKLPDSITDIQKELIKRNFKGAGLPGSWFGETGEEHKISASTAVAKTTISASPETLTEENSVTLTITNNRTSSIVDANLTIVAGEEHVNTKLPSEVISGTITVTYTKADIQHLFTSYTIKSNDAISFTLVRSGAYEVKNNRLYKFDDFNNSNLVSDDDIKALNQKFLIEDSVNNEFILSKQTYIDYLNNLTSDASIYLIYGDFENNNGVTAKNKVRLTIHGVCNADGVSYSSIVAYPTDKEEKEGYVHYTNIELNLLNLNVKGRPDDGTKEWYWYSDLTTGIIATPKPSEDPEKTNYTSMTATNCKYTGAFTSSYDHAVYNYCTFDSTNDKKPAGSGKYKNIYPMYIYTYASAEFHNCTFNSIGKAVKIYADGGQEQATTKPIITFDTCHFNLRDTTTCCEWESPINIDSTYYTKTGLEVWYNDCDMNKTWSDIKPLYNVVDTQTGGYYDHVTINGNPVPVPA